MHISVIHDIFYHFSSGVMNVENKENNPLFVTHYCKVFIPCPLTLLD